MTGYYLLLHVFLPTYRCGRLAGTRLALRNTIQLRYTEVYKKES